MIFLKDFPKRMRSVGRYAVLMNNSFQKTTWKQYGIENTDEQVNMIFTVLLYIMENSLKEENCTIDDIGEFIGMVNDRYYKRKYSYEDLKNFADFIVNVILSNSGNAMYFKGYDYEKKEYTQIYINYIANKIIYLDNGVRRTSYYLTDEGYNMMLSTMELENNLKLTVHEMLFKLHLEKADYGRAVNDIKNVFDQLRIQTQKIQEAMGRIRQNALAYSVSEYRQIIEENIQTIEDTRQKFKAHKEVVENRVKEFEEQEINIHRLSNENKESMDNLKVIEGYLNRSLDQHQSILNAHFDLKSLYDMELENYSNMTMIQRFNFRSELYDRVLQNAELLENINELFKPLFCKNAYKIYNPNKAFEFQKKIQKSFEEDDTIELGLDEELYNKEQEIKLKERLKKYEDSLSLIISEMVREQGTSLARLKETVFLEQKNVFMPSVEIFREIIIELLTAQVINIEDLRKERSEYFMETSKFFRLNEMLLDIIEEKHLHRIKKIHVMKAKKEEMIYFEQVKNDGGEYKNIRCSNVEIWYEEQEV